MRFSLFGFFLFIVFSNVEAQTVSDRKIKRQVQKIDALKNGVVAIAVKKLNHSKAVVAYNDDTYMTPASNTKLLTFLGAIQNLDAIPSLEYYKENDSITHFRSTGYPLLLHPFYEDKALNDFLKQQGHLVYHPSKISVQRFQEAWAWDDYAYYFGAETSSFPIYGNVVSFEMDEDSIISVHPDYFRKMVQSDTLVHFPKLNRLEHRNRFQVNPKKWVPKSVRYHPFRTSDSLFIKLLSEGINRPVRFATSAEAPTFWKVEHSAIADTLYKALLHDSDNLVAESLLLMIAKKETDSLSTKKAITMLQSDWNSFLPDPLEWVDGSGVSRYNMFTPRSLVAILTEIHNRIGTERIKVVFPSTALSGIQKDPKGSNTPYVYAKTGTLRHNVTLSGYLVGRKNTLYAFSIMMNHVTAPKTEVREGIGTLLAYLRKKM